MNDNNVDFDDTYTSYSQCLTLIGKEIGENWDLVTSSYPDLKAYARFEDFKKCCNLEADEKTQALFLLITKDYCVTNNRINANLLLTLSADMLQFFVFKRCYLLEYTEPMDRWNGTVNLFLETIKTYANQGYDYTMLRKLFRSKIEQISRKHQKTCQYKAQIYQEQAFTTITTQYWTDESSFAIKLLNKEYVNWLQEKLRPDEWDIIVQCYVHNMDCRTYAESHNKTYESIKKMRTRTKKKSVEILNRKFPNITF